MDCETCRAALSARLDGESEPVPAADTDRHVDECASCRAWQHDAAAVTRALRVRPTVPVPDFAPAIALAANRRGLAWPRVALGLVGALQVSLGLAQVLGMGEAPGHAWHADAPVSAHLFNESTAWNLALGIGLLWTAIRPRAAGGVLPVMAGFITVLAAFSVHDLVTGATNLARVSSHALLVIGLVLLIVVQRGERGPKPVEPEMTLPDSPHGSGGTLPQRQSPTTGRAPRLRAVRGRAA